MLLRKQKMLYGLFIFQLTITSLSFAAACSPEGSSTATPGEIVFKANVIGCKPLADDCLGDFCRDEIPSPVFIGDVYHVWDECEKRIHLCEGIIWQRETLYRILRQYEDACAVGTISRILISGLCQVYTEEHFSESAKAWALKDLNDLMPSAKLVEQAVRVLDCYQFMKKKFGDSFFSDSTEDQCLSEASITRVQEWFARLSKHFRSITRKKKRTSRMYKAT